MRANVTPLASRPFAKRTFAIAALGTALLGFASLAVGAEPIDGVLIIHGNVRAQPATVVIGNVLGSVVTDALQRPVYFFEEYLDVEWVSKEADAIAQAEFLRQKYSGRNVRVIVADASAAFQFTLNFRDRMFPGVPVVHVSVPIDQLEGVSLPADIVGKPIDLDPTETLRFALRLQPGAERIVIVLGAAPRDRIWEQRLRKAVAQLEGHPEVEYIAGLSTAATLQRLGALSKDSIVFTPGYFLDGVGQVGTPAQSAKLIGSASAAPVYGPSDTFIGTGIVGGYMAPFDDQATQAGALVVRLLNGTPPAAIAPSSLANVPVVDWRQIRRWGFDERLLPAETDVRFREPTGWGRYRLPIAIGTAVLLIQAALIASLLLERRSRRRIASALEENQKRMNLAARAARLSLWNWDVASDRLWATNYLRARAGLPETPIAFEEVLAKVHPADREQLDHAVRKATATGEELDVEYRMTEQDGTVRWIAARGRAGQVNGGHLLGVAVDITERKLAEMRAVEDRAALRHMTRVSMLGQLSASIAHQLNQPLAAILGNAEAAQKMLSRDGIDLAELREICDDIVTEDNRAAEVIRRLGALYKRGDMKTEPLDLNELIHETLELLRAELLTRNIVLRTELAPGVLMVDGGRVQLQQVLLNLILNAADAMDGLDAEDRTVTIHSEAAGADIRLTVVDNGPGIADEDLKRVFDAFWSTKSEGMGVGLAICQSIVAAHHGHITATNNADGGATFCVTLPVRHPT